MPECSKRGDWHLQNFRELGMPYIHGNRNPRGAAAGYRGNSRFAHRVHGRKCFYDEPDKWRLICSRYAHFRGIILRHAGVYPSSQGPRVPAAGYGSAVAGARSAVCDCVFRLGFGAFTCEALHSNCCGICSGMFTCWIDFGAVAWADAPFEIYTRPERSKGGKEEFR